MIGVVRQAQGDLQGALASYQECLKISQKLAAADPTNANAQRDLSVSHLKIGEVRQAHGDLKGALASYQEYQKISQQLAAADPSNANAQRDLSICHSKIGEVQHAAGDLQGALTSYQEGLKISQKLAAADQTNALAQRDLLIFYSKLGLAARSLHDYLQSAAWFEKALQLAQSSSRPDFFARDILDLQRDLRWSRATADGLEDLATIRQLADADRPAILTAVILAHIHRKTPDKAIAAADLLLENAKTPVDTYNAARGYALCVPLTDKPEEKERYAARAVALLKQAVEKGFKDVSLMKKDTALGALRDRDDFKACLKDCEEKLKQP